MVYPKALKKGDKIGIIAPSGPIGEERYEKILSIVRKMELIPVEGQSFRQNTGYLAGPDYVRAADFNKMFADKEIKGVFCTRGGYGSQRIISKIDWKTVRQNPKIFMGYSDITALHICISQFCGFVTYHSPVLNELCDESFDSPSFKSFRRNIFENHQGGLSNPENIPAEIITGGKASGIITGGNLSMIVSSLSTPYEIDTKGKILILEEVGENVYRLDRMFNQLKNAKKLDDAAGFIIGYFIDRKNGFLDGKSYEKDAMEIVKEYIAPFKKPAVANICFGHRIPNITIPIGARAEINEDKIFVY